MSLKTKKVFILLLMASLILFNDVLSPARLAADSSEAKSFKKPYGGTLVIGHNNPPTIINPILTDSSVSMSVMTLVFNRLVVYSSEGEIRPDLAEFWEVSPDGLIYTFHIRHGVRFHDGVELTAEDVLFTYQNIKNPEIHSPYFSNLNLVKKMEAVNRYTFKVILESPSVSFLDSMTREIVPKHLYEKENLRTGGFNWYPIGTGPFKFEKWESNKIILKSNPDYFEGRPFLNEVIYKYYPTGDDVWAAFMRGEIDMAEFLSVENYELTKIDKSFRTYANATSDYYAISYNLSDSLMADKSIRFAIAHAIDLKGLIQYAEMGYGLEAVGPFNSRSWAFNPNFKKLAYDPSAALDLLNKAGWIDTDHDGILDKNGTELVIKMLVLSKDTKLKKIALFIRQNLQEVGIRVEICLFDDISEVEQLASSRSYQAFLTFFLGPGLVDPSETIEFWDSLNRRTGNIWVNSQSNLAINNLIREGVITKGIEARKKIYQEIHRLIYEEQPACFLYFPFDFHGVSKKIGGTDPFLGSLSMPDNLIKDFYLEGGDSHGDHTRRNR